MRISEFFDSIDPNRAEDNIAGYIEEEQRAQRSKDSAVRRASKEITVNEARLEQAGFGPTPDPEPGMLRTILDGLDTPKQWTQGALASLFNLPGYEDTNILTGAMRGAEQDVGAAELLRPHIENPWLRGFAGFFGDVATDPLSWFTLGASQGARIGGAAISDDAVRLAGGAAAAPRQIFNTLAEKETTKLVQGFLSDNAALGLRSVDDIPEDILAGFSFQAEKEIANKFGDAKAVVDQLKRDSITKAAGGLLTPEMLDSTALKAQQVVESFGLSGPEEISKMFKPRAVRGTSPFYGIEQPLGRIPVLGDAEFDIPGVTKVTEKIYDNFDKLWYGTPIKLQRVISDGIKNSPDSQFWNQADKLALKVKDFHSEVAVKMASLVSRRVATTGEIFGPADKRNLIQEEERARGAMLGHSIKRGHFLFQKLLEHGDTGEALIKGGTPVNLVDEMSYALERGADDIERAIKEVADKFDARSPGLGATATNIMRQVQADFASMAAKEAEKGLLNNVISSYVYHMYNNKADALVDFEDPRWAKLQQMFGPKDAEDFSLQRTMRTLRDAQNKGLRPDTNLANLYSARLYWHQRIIAEKDFAERIAFRYGMSKEAYDSLAREATKTGINQIGELAARRSADAVDQMRRMGVGIDTKKYAVEAIYNSRDNVIGPEEYQALYRNFHSGDEALRAVAEQEANNVGLTFQNPEEELARVTDAFNTYKSAQTMIPTRMGNSLFTPGGGSTLGELTKKRFFGDPDKYAKLAPDEKMFWNSVLPESFVRHLDESYQTYELMRGNINRVARETPTRFSKAFSWITSIYKHMHRTYKEGATRYWPAYYARNVMGAPWQALEAATIIGQAVNPFNLYRTISILRDEGVDAFDVAGRRLPRKQLLSEMADFNINGSMLNSMEMLDTYGDMLAHQFASPAMLRQMPGLKKMYNLAEPDKGMISKALEWANIKKAGSGVDKAWEKFRTFGDRLDAFGRQQLYINRRLMGDAPQDASAIANRLLIDYNSGKTAFERNFLNNIFFFYSFSRGQATNTFLQLMRKPGALTQQLHAFNNTREAFMSAYDYDEEEARDYEHMIRTTRGGEGLADYLGKSKITGKPVVMSSLGLPVEDLARYATIYQPQQTKGKTTVGDLYHSIEKSGNRTLLLLLAQSNPAIRGTVELLTQRNLFYDKPITDEALRKIPSFERSVSMLAPFAMNSIPPSIWENVDDAVKKILAGKENPDGTITISPTAMIALTYFLPGINSVTSRIPRAITTLKGATSLSTTEDQRWLRFLSGIKIGEVDPESSVIYDKRKRQKERMEFLGVPSTKSAFSRYMESMEEDREDDSD